MHLHQQYSRKNQTLYRQYDFYLEYNTVMFKINYAIQSKYPYQKCSVCYDLLITLSVLWLLYMFFIQMLMSAPVKHSLVIQMPTALTLLAVTCAIVSLDTLEVASLVKVCTVNEYSTFPPSYFISLTHLSNSSEHILVCSYVFLPFPRHQ